ncbi:hypothetical protein T459_33810 [Capsicum annuum]|uniref:FBD domain-containing protein n=1 Tax=Capsicum annuum TaxID=4072 RepID=A0A2G2XXS6_CAPAN|nr:hypothetical protein T459_33810 [Capsicum annuum]
MESPLWGTLTSSRDFGLGRPQSGALDIEWETNEKKNVYRAALSCMIRMAMADSGNILAIRGKKLDRLTDLPINIIHQIQDRISVQAAAKMSVLSRAWRYIWSSNPRLIFATGFCTMKLPSKTIDIITAILLQHHGSVKTFSVDISPIHSSQHPVVDRWILFLSRNGLMDLSVLNEKSGNTPYKLPSYVYNVELEHLVLSNCIFRPPCSFRGFHKLRKLLLTQVSFELDVATSSLWMPSLETLQFIRCSGLRFLNIYAPKLLYLHLIGCGIDALNLGPFMVCSKLKMFGLVEQEVSLNRQDKTMKPTDIILSWPNLNRLILGKCFVKFFPSDAGVDCPPMRQLKALHLANYDFDSEDQMFALASILRNSPNLEILSFHMLSQRKKDDMEVDENSSQKPDYGIQQLLNNLRILQISRFHGSRAELLFIKFILASVPLLQKAILLVETSVCESLSLKISKELMRFPRASPKSEIIYEPWSERSKYSKLFLVRGVLVMIAIPDIDSL